MSHALLSPSSSERWINCPPSAKENTDSDTGSSYAQQGTDAHTLCEFKVNQALGHMMKDRQSSVVPENLFLHSL